MQLPRSLAAMLTFSFLALGSLACGDDIEPPPEIAAEDVEIGHHSEFVSRDPPTDWTRIEDGSFVPVVLGGQGINMVLLGVRSRADLVPPLMFRLRLAVEGDRRGTGTFSNQVWVTDEGDGWRGVYNLFMALDGCRTWSEGTSGEVTVTIDDSRGASFETVVPVILGENDLC